MNHVFQDSAAEIRKFHYRATDDELADLKQRIAMTRWPDRETVEDASQGAQRETVRKLVQRWGAGYDWRNVETRINGLPNFVTRIDGVDMHFLHVRSNHESALPLLVAHGWPGTFVSLLKIVGPLTDPTAHGGSEADAFHLVIPSMPGYGFSGKPTETGWDPIRVAGAYIALMERLDYHRWGAQGGDWGAIVVEQMALKQPPGLIGIHTNMAGAVPHDIDVALQRGEPLPPNLTDEAKQACDELAFAYRHIGYAQLLGDRPQTMVALADSPVALAAFLIDNVPKSYELYARSIDRAPEGITPDDILDNLTLFWLTNTPVSAARLYWENRTPYFAAKGVTIPVAVSVFPDELYRPPKSWAEKAYPRLVHYNKLPKGGHFPSWEQPEAFSREVRAGFRGLR